MPYSSEVLADSPVGYWRLDDTSGTSMLDASGNSRHGTYFNAPTLGATSLLPVSGGTAVAFDGSSDYAQITHNAAFNAASGVGFSVEMWLKVTNPAATTLQVIADKTGTSGGNGQWGIWWDNRSSVQRLTVLFPGLGSLLWSGSAPAAALAAGGHFVFTYDPALGVSGGKIFWDSSLIPESRTGAAYTYTANTRAIDLATAGSSFRMGGVLDELAIYQATLPEARIVAHYGAGISSAIAGQAFAVTTAMRDGAASAPPIVITGEPFEVPVYALDGQPNGDAEISGEPFVVAVTAVDGEAVGPTVYTSDLTYANDGYNYTGLARVFYDPPVAEPPAHVRRTKVRRVHQSMPAPTLVDGRPT